MARNIGRNSTGGASEKGEGVDNEAAIGRVLDGRRGCGRAPGGRHGDRGGDSLAAQAPARGVGVGAVVRRVRVGAVGGGRVVPALRRGAVPLHPRRVRLRQVRAARQGVPQVQVAARPAVRRAEVRRCGAAADVERKEGDVRGRLAGAEPVRVAALHAARGRARRAHHHVAGVGEDQPLTHRPVRGLQRDTGVLRDALPGGHGDGQVRARAQARRDRPGAQLARRRRARLRLVALVAAHRQDAALGLHPGRRRGGEGHGPDAGVRHGAAHLGEMGRCQPRPDRHESLLPGNLPVAQRRAGLGRVGEDDVHGADAAAQRHGGVPRRPDPAAVHPAERARRHGQAGVPARLHLPLAAAQGRAPHQVQRRRLRRGLHALVHRRPTGHLERTLLRRTHRTAMSRTVGYTVVHSSISKRKRWKIVLYRGDY